MRSISLRPQGLLVAATVALASLVASAPIALADSPTYSGRATAVNATVLGVQTVIADTGPVPSSGGAKDASLLNASVPNTLTAEAADASTVAGGGQSNSEASLANVNLTLPGGNTITADLLMANTSASCGSGGATASGNSQLVNVVVNGTAVGASAPANTTIPLLSAGYVVLNEQTSSPGSFTVNAVHAVIPGVADVVIASAHSDITCPSSGPASCSSSTPNDRFTGGGYITGTPKGGRGNFGMAGGYQNDGSLWGHLAYIDHGLGLKVKGDRVTNYTFSPTFGPQTGREIDGIADVTDSTGVTDQEPYVLDVADNGEPGYGHDDFIIRLPNRGYTATGFYQGQAPLLDAGNLQLHRPISCP